jgi:uncharacterized protein RhaS with RHS repeats
VIAEYDSSDTLLRKFIYGTGIDEPLIMKTASTKYYYFSDGLGNITNIGNNSSQIIESYAYDVYGAASVISSVGNPYYFTGIRYDSETQLYYYRARMYDPELGRFLQEV